VGWGTCLDILVAARDEMAVFCYILGVTFYLKPFFLVVNVGMKIIEREILLISSAPIT
jgi:hypothetical protein